MEVEGKHSKEHTAASFDNGVVHKRRSWPYFNLSFSCLTTYDLPVLCYILPIKVDFPV